MIKLIYGAKGTGKTKAIISAANDSVAAEKGNIVFLTDTSRYMFELHRDIRFVNTKEFEITTEPGLIGLIKGLKAGNSDISKIFIDGAARMTFAEVEDMELFFEYLEKISDTDKVDFVLTVSADKLPDFLEKYK